MSCSYLPGIRQGLAIAEGEKLLRHPETAYLADMQRGMVDVKWKQLRIEKARAVLPVLRGISPAKIAFKVRKRF